MLIGLVVVAALLGMKINGVIYAPWWLVVVVCFITMIVGMLISGNLKLTAKIEVVDD